MVATFVINHNESRTVALLLIFHEICFRVRVVAPLPAPCSAYESQTTTLPSTDQRGVCRPKAKTDHIRISRLILGMTPHSTDQETSRLMALIHNSPNGPNSSAYGPSQQYSLNRKPPTHDSKTAIGTFDLLRPVHTLDFEEGSMDISRMP